MPSFRVSLYTDLDGCFTKIRDQSLKINPFPYINRLLKLCSIYSSRNSSICGRILKFYGLLYLQQYPSKKSFGHQIMYLQRSRLVASLIENIVLFLLYGAYLLCDKAPSAHPRERQFSLKSTPH